MKNAVALLFVVAATAILIPTASVFAEEAEIEESPTPEEEEMLLKPVKGPPTVELSISGDVSFKDVIEYQVPDYPDWIGEGDCHGVEFKGQVRVKPNGKLDKYLISVKEGSGNADWDQAAIKTLRKWKFQRSTDNGERNCIVTLKFTDIFHSIAFKGDVIRINPDAALSTKDILNDATISLKKSTHAYGGSRFEALVAGGGPAFDLKSATTETDEANPFRALQPRRSSS
ncbi:energy transducer TonB [candidate division WOR-3 bacterium]|nr:energy transducer TonB [candidate division WOR-3 bacterium]